MKIKCLMFMYAFCITSTLQGTNYPKSLHANYGAQHYNKETVDSVSCNGSVSLEETEVKETVQVNGNLSAEDSTIGSLQINGNTSLENCIIKKPSTVNGSLTAVNTSFNKNLAVASEKIVLKKCSLDSLTIKKVGGFSGIQVADLRDGTTLTGYIVFESGKGEIWVSRNNTLSDSQVKGATIVLK